MGDGERWTIWRVLDPSGRGFHSGWSLGTPFAHLKPDDCEVIEVARAEPLDIALDALKRGAYHHNCDYCRADVAAVERAMGRD
jgi:hypothetical protein